MLARRLLLFATIMLALTLLGTLLAPPAQENREPATPSAGGAVAPADAELEPVEVTLDIAGGEREAEVAEGDIVHLVVRSDRDDSIELRGFDLVRTVAPETAAEFDVYADEAGDYDLVALEAGETVGTLRVTPP